MNKKICECCGEEESLGMFDIKGRRHCPHCSTDHDAIEYLKSQKLDPAGVYEILYGRVNFYRLTLAVAKIVAEMVRKKHDAPH